MDKLLIGCLCFALGYWSGPPRGKHDVYVYKQLDPGGLLCVFYSNYPGLAERNARMYVEMERERYGNEFTIRSTPF